ncbi:MAG: RNA 2'-phosphotransferase, partial [Planctomycetaceae bacterium]|nr:RNA 2'-phosphotransferase [Planctomycetaceae bacterium]
MTAAFPPPKEERLPSDDLVITSYSQNPADPNFYQTGLPSMGEMLQTIFRAHDWSPTYDPAWKFVHENAGKAGGSGRTAAATCNLTPDPDTFDEGVYLFDDLTTYRKGNWKNNVYVVDSHLSLRILDLSKRESWHSIRRWNLEYSRPQNAWDPVSRVLTKMLRWDGCVKGRRNTIPCDAGGWFPLQLIEKLDLGGMSATMQLILNIVANDQKGRFQVCAEVTESGRIYDYFAIRAVSGHGIPYIDPHRLSCPINRKDLDLMGCVTHVTTKTALIGIFRGGLIPGGAASRSVRAETNFGCYFADDRRRKI